VSQDWDVICVGGGNNGLTTTAYLARAGLRCLVLERSEIVGGGAMTEPFPGAPGYMHNTHAQLMMWIRNGPMYADLELERYGLEMISLEPQLAMVYREGPPLVVYKDIDRTAESIAAFSKADADRYRDLANLAVAEAPLGLFSFYNLAAPPSTAAMVLEGSREGMEYLRQLQTSPERIVDDYFESEQLKAYLLAQLPQGGSTTNRMGLGNFVFLVLGLTHNWGMHCAKGGTNSVAKALIKVIEAHGGSVLNNSHVDRVLVEGGRAVGVRLAGGEEIRAGRAVVAGAGHWQLVDHLVDEAEWGTDPDSRAFFTGVKRFRIDDVALYTTHLALKNPPEWVGSQYNEDVNRTLGVYWGTDDTKLMKRQMWDCTEHIRPSVMGGLACTHSVADPSVNPGGGHSTFTWMPAPYELDDNPANWDEINAELGEQLVAEWRRYAPNLTDDNIVARVHYSPLDLERRTISMKGGSMMLGDCSPDQMGAFRPVPGWAHHRTPIESLYVAAASCHPFAGVNGAPGRNAAEVIVGDLGVARWWPEFSL
jgi:phytoene dehydrogenase-like protein